MSNKYYRKTSSGQQVEYTPYYDDKGKFSLYFNSANGTQRVGFDNEDNMQDFAQKVAPDAKQSWRNNGFDLVLLEPNTKVINLPEIEVVGGNSKQNSDQTQPEGEIMYNPEIGATSFRARFPKVDGGADFGEAVVTAKADGTTSAMRLTSPRVDAESQIFDVNPPASFYEGLDNTVPKEVIKPFIPKLMSVNKPGAYLSGDAEKYPLGNKVINTYSSDGIIPAIKTIFTETSPNYVDRMGLSPDSYAALIKWPNKSSNTVVRWGPGFTTWNPSAVKNKHVYDAFKRWESGEIPFEQYEQIFNTWSKEIGGRPLQYTIINDKKIPVHPHPFIHIKGGYKK